MSWRDRIDEELRGSFRGVEFHVERSSTRGGRRWLIHEYPRRDTPSPEDMGKAKREWRLNLVVFGENYDQKRNALIQAFDAQGIGTLVHPYLGTVRAVATQPEWSESAREGGICRFQVTFVQASEIQQPQVQVDTQRQVEVKAVAAREAVEADFQERYNVIELAADRVATIERDLRDALSAIDSAVGDVTGPAADAIRAPVDLAAAVIGGISRIETTFTEPARALTIYSQLFEAGRKSSTNSSDPAQRKTQINASNAITDLVRLAGTIQACQSSAGWEYEASNDALATMNQLTDGLDAQSETATPLDHSVYNTLSDLRAAVVEDLRSRGAQLPRLRTYTPQVTLPALVIAHHVYGDANRADEIIRRNSIAHPGTVRGGTDLEVLSE